MVRWGIDKVMNGKLVFLVEYAYGNFTDLPHWSEFENHEETRGADKRTLAERHGGALGIDSVKEVIAGVKEVEEAHRRRRSFLSPVPENTSGLWKIADGPSMRLVSSSGNAIRMLALKVSSLKQAETFLAERDMLGSLVDQVIRLAPEQIHGLDVRFVEQ